MYFFLELQLTGPNYPRISGLIHHSADISKQMSLPTMSLALLTNLVVFAPRSIPEQAVTYQSHQELELVAQVAIIFM